MTFASAALAAFDEHAPALHQAMRVDRGDSAHELPSERLDGAADVIRLIVDVIAQHTFGIYSPAAARVVAAAMVARVVDANAKQKAKQIKRSLGVGLFAPEPWMAEFQDQSVEANVAILLTIPALARIETAIREGVRAGYSVQEIRLAVVRGLAISARASKAIAGDQVRKTFGQVDSRRNSALGVTHGRWSTVGDGRVRASHAALEGVVYLLSRPPLIRPSTGQRLRPGEDYNCRCGEVPVLDEIARLLPHVTFGSRSQRKRAA